MNAVAAALAGGANASSASVESLGEALGQVGPGATNAGLSLQQTVGVLSAFDAAGIKGSDAGTSLKTMLSRLAPQTEKSATAMKHLHLNFVDAHGDFLPITKVAEQLRTNLSGLSEEQRTTALTTIFGSDATRAATVLMKEGAGGIAKYIKATKDQDAAQRVANARMKGTAGAVEQFKGSLETATLQFGRFIAPAVISGLHLLTDGINGIGPTFHDIGKRVGPAAEKLHDFFTNGAGHKALAASFDVMSDAADHLRSGLGKAADALGRIADGVSEIDFGNLDTKSLGQALADGILNAIDTLAQQTGAIIGKIGDVFAAIDWVGLGIQVGTLALPFVLGLATGLINGISDPALWKGIWEHLPEILIAALSIAFLPSKLAAPLERILTRIPFVGKFLAATVRWLQALGDKLKSFGGDLFKAFREGFGSIKFPGAGIISKVLGAFKGLPGRLLNFWKTMETRLGVWALEAFEAAGRGARKGVTKLISFVGTIGGKILKGIGKLGDLLKPIGEDIVNGLKNGIAGAWHFVTDKIDELVKKIPAPIRKFLHISSPSKLFRDIGIQIPAGLAEGIRKGGDKAHKALATLAKKLTERFSSLVGRMSEIGSSVRDAFRPDLFSGSLSDLLGTAASSLGTLPGVLKAVKKLSREGISGAFLQQLFASGNTDLILALAAGPASQAKSAQSQFNQIQRLTSQIGTAVSGVSPEAAELAKVRHALDVIHKELRTQPHKTGRETANALNDTAAAAKRRRKVS
jgi:phage-related protein